MKCTRCPFLFLEHNVDIFGALPATFVVVKLLGDGADAVYLLLKLIDKLLVLENLLFILRNLLFAVTDLLFYFRTVV